MRTYTCPFREACNLVRADAAAWKTRIERWPPSFPFRPSRSPTFRVIESNYINCIAYPRDLRGIGPSVNSTQVHACKRAVHAASRARASDQGEKAAGNSQVAQLNVNELTSLCERRRVDFTASVELLNKCPRFGPCN